MKFIGRQSELKRITKTIETEGQSAILVYGRRRVGKSELIKRALELSDARSVYYECKQTSEQNNAESLSALISQEFGLPPLAFTSMEQVVAHLFEQAKSDRLVLVLDEYPYLRAAVTGFDSVLQSLLDQNVGRSRMKLVLCGSYIDTMKSLLDESSPLYGRIDLTIKLLPMDCFDAALFYPSLTSEDKVRMYSVLGGVPYYLRLVDEGASVRENIRDLVASPGARLENEVPLHLRTELSKLANANEAFEALSRGSVKFGDILSQSHVSSSPALADVLARLCGMELVEKVVPINDPGNKRRAGYRIADPLSAFHYRYVFRYSSQMQVMDPDAFFERFIASDFEEQYVPHAFEEVARQYLIRLNKSGGMEEPFELIGKFSYDDPKAKKNGEFDVVTKDALGYVPYEVKFRKSPLSRAMLDEERRQVDASPLDCSRYGFVSRSGFSCEARDDETFITLEDMFGG